MATPIGTNVVNSITRRWIEPSIVDNFYRSNVLFFRLYMLGKKMSDGGTQIEQPLLRSRGGSATWFSGFDVIDTTPQDPIQNAAYDWKNISVAVTVDDDSLEKNDSPESIANLLLTLHEGARMEAEDQIGLGLFSDAVTNSKVIDGLQGAIDNGTVAATYAGLGNRTTTNSFWQPFPGGLDTATTVLTLASMQAVFGSVTDGARHPTLLIGTQGNYNRYWNLLQVQQRFPSQPMGSDEQLAKAGFTNLLFNNVPFAVDSHCNTSRAGVTGDSLYYLDENFIQLKVKSGVDFALTDAIRPVNQHAVVQHIKWKGNLCFSNLRLQGAQTAIAA